MIEVIATLQDPIRGAILHVPEVAGAQVTQMTTQGISRVTDSPKLDDCRRPKTSKILVGGEGRRVEMK